MASFPPLRSAVLTGLVDLKDNLETLDSPDCPYDNDTKELLRKLLAPREIERVVEKVVGGPASPGRGRPSKDIKLSTENQQLVLDEILDNLRTIRDMKIDDGDTSARVQLVKTRSNEIEKLLKLQERHAAVAMVQGFMDEVLLQLEANVSEEGREHFMKWLDGRR